MYIYVHICTYMYICIYKCIYSKLHIHKHRHIHMHIHMHMHIHIHIRHRALGHDSGVFLRPSRSLLDVWMSVLEIPKGFLGARTSAGVRGLRDFILMIFWLIFRYPILSDFGANLAPTCLPTWTQNPPKSVPRGFQIPSQLASCFEYPCLSILGASWVDFWWVLGLKLGAKFIKKSIIWPLVGKLAEITKNTKFADSSTL